ncbi:mCpol domain-containing protein [Pseudoalteromonas rubra]|uniref:MCpol domain-containing protein n=1 Tax=Pseudoalteromonas rubra TaxID=43658 RepID=A0A5S3V5G7_9GAMM|nr:mCpol domain-containing protein [Pseudoalteromonas rubra]QPB83490.1 mCpol domain-containing protein [Pseudoalteromonas rubra]
MYIVFDGDEIGKQLEKLIFSDCLEQAASYSALIAMELQQIREHLIASGCEVVFCGGDSILVKASSDFIVSPELLSKNGITWSVGVGEKPSDAALALKKAKAFGRNRVEIFGVE